MLDLILLIVCAGLAVYSWLAGKALERALIELANAEAERDAMREEAEKQQHMAAYWQREATARRDDVLRHVGAGE